MQEVYVCGLAFDYCVGSTALDSKKFGFKTYVIEEGTKSVAKDSEAAMRKKLEDAQVSLISVSEVPGQ